MTFDHFVNPVFGNQLFAIGTERDAINGTRMTGQLTNDFALRDIEDPVLAGCSVGTKDFIQDSNFVVLISRTSGSKGSKLKEDLLLATPFIKRVYLMNSLILRHAEVKFF